VAFSQLLGLRLRVNSALGLASDTDDQPFGAVADRNEAIRLALATLWPTMARLQRETLTIVAAQFDYTLTTLKDVQSIEVVDTTSLDVVDMIKTFRVIQDEAVEPATIRIRFEAIPRTTTSLRVIGYAPYTSNLVADGDFCDLPVRLEYIVVLGATANLYKRKLNQRMNFQQHAVASRENDVTVNEMLSAYTLVKREYDQALDANRRFFVAAKTERVGRP
jgi:hypothetical protein